MIADYGLQIAERRLVAIVASVIALPASLAAQSAVEWVPADPAQGSFVIVVVRPDGRDSVASVSGQLAGQALHFEGDGTSYRALAALPIRAAVTTPVMITVERARTPVEHRFIRMPVRQVEFPTERLSVDPRFTTPPDSALQARIDEENRKSRAVSRNAHQTPRLWRGAFQTPVSARITSPYGMGRLFNGQLTSRHYGVDFDGDRGDPVQAPNRGAVALTGDFYYGGNVVYLDHGAGLVTAYLHLSEILVSQGDTVEAGQLIGRIGATGRVTGPHLHWVGRYGTVTVDPLSLIDVTQALANSGQ
jgi:murein DD-endopeptidase MepM/ murein hydrolase activator NlpD